MELVKSGVLLLLAMHSLRLLVLRELELLRRHMLDVRLMLRLALHAGQVLLPLLVGDESGASSCGGRRCSGCCLLSSLRLAGYLVRLLLCLEALPRVELRLSP